MNPPWWLSVIASTDFGARLAISGFLIIAASWVVGGRSKRWTRIGETIGVAFWLLGVLIFVWAHRQV